MKNNKILFIAPLNSIHSVRWINYFSQNGYEIHVIDSAFSPSQNHELSGVNIYQLPITGTKIPIIIPE